MSATVDLQRRINAEIAAMRADHEQGASAIAQRAVRLLLDICQARISSALSPVEARDLLRATCGQVETARPSMAPLAHVARRAVLATTGDDAAQALHTAQTALDAIIADGRDAPERIGARLATRLGKRTRVVTLSRSATVTRSLKQAHEHIAAVTCLESRPGGEGMDAAREIAAALPHIQVRLVADAALALAVADADCAIVGADALLAEGYAVNKTGTHPLALAARDAHIPLYIVTERIKIAPADWVWQPERFDPSLIAPNPSPGVTVEAVVFERTPLALVTIIGPDGVITADDISKIANELSVK
jgi:translation initiation factor 2B subunit (eIF-2B alpha/beta/delta family)